nr:MAG TPA: AAA domain protein [Caudoviricetes sp.]
MAVTCVNNQGTPGDANAYWISGNTIYLYGHGGGSGKTYIVIGK